MSAARYLAAGTVLVAVVLVISIYLLTGKIKQLTQKNKLLRALRRLDALVHATNDLATTCQDIVDVIRQEFGYLFGAIALFDPQAKGIRRVAISREPLVEGILKQLPMKYSDQVVPLTVADNLLVKAYLEKNLQYSPKIHDIQKGALPEDVSERIQKILNVKGVYIYPLVTSNDVIGVIYYAPQIERSKIHLLEFEVMESFTNEVSRILDNILLYQNLSFTSRKLLAANRELIELDTVKDEFVSVASHELRTPMTVIRSYAWMALHRSDVALSSKVEKYLIRILLSTEKMIHLVDDMLDISRIESGRVEIHSEPVDLIPLCKDIADEVYYSKSTQKNISFVILQRPIPKALVDPDKIRQILLNIVDNAVKYSPVGGKITLGFRFDDKMIETYIQDEGVGIRKDDLERLFQKFGRLDSSFVAAASSGGTGLGLYISRKLAQLMRGNIRGYSEGPGKGATFSVVVPRAL